MPERDNPDDLPVPTRPVATIWQIEALIAHIASRGGNNIPYRTAAAIMRRLEALGWKEPLIP